MCLLSVIDPSGYPQQLASRHLVHLPTLGNTIDGRITGVISNYTDCIILNRMYLLIWLTAVVRYVAGFRGLHS